MRIGEEMTSFSVVRKKTPFQKHREEEEAKKRRADEEAARLYEEFVESFKADEAAGGKAFVRGGTIDPNERLKSANEGTGSKDGSSGSKKPGSRYVPSFIPPGLASIVNKGKEPEKNEEEEKPKERERARSRNIDHFMEELKIEQELREKRGQDKDYRSREGRQKGNSTPPSRFDEPPEELDPNGKLLGSFDDGDPQTTNLYVGNLSPQVDENFLLRTFGRFGPIASVKIMWPRTDEERRRQRNCGFVAFMRRAEAQAAKDEMQGVVVYEYDLRIGWGKGVALPAQALPAPPPGQMAIRSKEGSTVAWSGPGAPPTPAVTSQAAELVVTPNVPDIEVTPPEDEHIRRVIDTMAMYVLDDGCAFEQAIMERGRGNQLFNFLFDLGSKEHTYYVWRLYSFAQGDTLQRWRTEPFIMISGSGRWMPPALPQSVTNKSPEHNKDPGTTFAAGRGRRVDQERALTDSQRDEFEDMLRALTLERSLIKEAMGFALDNADAAGEVVEVLTESLTLKETPIPTKVARLMLVSDVLHNSSAPVKNASAYRTKFEATLSDIMESFNDLYRSITGRITAEALKERVLKVLQVWSDWFLFSDSYINGLRATFLRPGNSGVPPFHSICGDAPPVKDVGNVDDLRMESTEEMDLGQDAALAIGEGAAAKELSRLPLAELERRCRHNGLSIRGGREVMVARLLSLEEVEKQKTEELDDDIRGSYGTTGMAKGTDTSKVAGWNAGANWMDSDGRWKGINRNTNVEHIEYRQILEGAPVVRAQWPRNEDDTENRTEPSRNTPIGSMPRSLSLPHPELKAFGTKHVKNDPALPTSKWNREDDNSDMDKQEVKSLGLSYSSSGSDEDIFVGSGKGEKQEGCVESAAVGDPSFDEERRQKLRRLEVAVMEYRELLEEHGVKGPEEIEKKVALHRMKLETEYGLVDVAVEQDGRGDHPSHISDKLSVKKDKRDGRRDSSSRKRIHSRSRSKSPSHARERSSRDREREKEKDIHRDRDRDWYRESENSKERLHDFDIQRDRERNSIRDRPEHERDRDRDRDGKDRGRSRERDKERDREKRIKRN